jgi:flagellar M-ring protein FliF
VLVDGVWEAQPSGPPQWRERTPEEMQRIATLARSAVGFDERRGDRVDVVSLRFAEPPPAEAAPQGFVILGQVVPPALLGRVVESAILAVVALAAILLLLRPLVGRLGVALAPAPSLAFAGAGDAGGTIALGGTEGAAMATGVAGDPATAGPAALPGAADDPLIWLARVDGQMRSSALQALADMVDKNPEQAVEVVRRWLAPEDGSQ